MAVNKNFVVKNGLEVNSQLIFADATNNKVGIASTQPNVELDVRGGIAATNTTVSGISTIQTGLRVGSGVAGTVFTALDDNVVGVGTSQPVFLLDVVSPVSSGTTALYVQGDVRFTGDLDVGAGVSVAGLSTFVGVGTFYEGFNSSGIATITQLEVLGFSTFRANLDLAADVGITSSLIVGAGVSVAGVSTFTGLTDLNGGLDVTGVSTFSTNVDINADVDINRSLTVTGGATVTGLSTFTADADFNSDIDVDGTSFLDEVDVAGLSTFSSNVDINADVDVNRSISIGGGIGVTGIGTIGRVKIFNDGTGGIVTATTGIITYYGDGQFLTNIQSGVGIATTNPTTGYSETVGLGATIITFAGPGVSTNAQHNGGTGVTVNAASGIATVYLAGGGSGGGFQTIIEKDSTTVGAGGSDIFTTSSRYTSGYVNVYVNGTKLNSADFTETNNETGVITLASAAVEGDIVELENFAVTAITGDFETLITKEEYTVTTAAQTVFDLNAEYRTGYIDVYLNGVRLSSSDYTETNSTRITLATAATFGDVLEFVNYERRSISELQPVWRNDGVGGGSGGIYTFTSVGIGTSAQTAFVDIYGGMKVRAGVVTIADSASSDILRVTDGGVNIVSGLTTVGTNLHVTGDLNIDGTGTHDIFGTVSLDNVAVAAGVTIGQTLEVNGDNHSIDNTTTMGNINATGIVTANSVVLSQNLTVGNDALITGNLTVNGTTTTLDTIVQEIDLLNIQANSSTPAIGVTQSGSGPIIAAYDGTSEVFRVDDGGNVGIGTDNPAGTFQVFNTTDSNSVTVDSAGRILIGRTSNLASSSEKLTLDSGMVIFRNNSTGTAPLYLRNEDTTADTRQPYLILTDGVGNRGGVGLQNDDSSLWISGQGGIRFRGNTSSPGNTEWARINSNGHVGINTTECDVPLHVARFSDGAGIYVAEFENNGNAADTESRILFRTRTGGDNADAYIGMIGPSANNSILTFATENSGTIGERLRIDSDGNMGLGGAAVVTSSGYNTAAFHLRQSGASKGAQLRMTTESGSGHTGSDGFVLSYWHDNNVYFDNKENGQIRFRTNGGDRLYITSGGQVNIGGNYTQTTYTSQITGTLNVTSTITQNGTPVATTGKAIAMAMVFG